jgi:N-acetylglucosaminyl-diphospho-decaprenol L-rhamnosyltransferase
VSVVSHGQGPLIAALMQDLAALDEPFRVLLTHNLPEEPVRIPHTIAPRTMVVSNPRPAGFATNHNAAFRRCETEFFCVINPDVRLPANPFPVLLSCLGEPTVGLAAPAVLSPEGLIESTGRVFPTLSGLVWKAAGGSDGRMHFELGGLPVRPDWIAGMFLLLRSDAFASIGGFDEGYHLYYEDVDLCARLRNAGYELLLCPRSTIVHAARRSSHRQPRFMLWHLQSMLRYFVRHRGRPTG